MRKINLDEWEHTGGGAFGTTYFHKEDPNYMLKFMSASTPIEVIENEVRNAENVYALGVPTPKPGELVTDGERNGIVFQRIVGKRSFARAVGEEPERIPEFARRFAAMARLLHSTPCDTTKFISAKEFNLKRIEEDPFRSAEVKDKVVNIIKSLPDSTTCLHGDLHFGNMIFVDDKDYFIDLVDFCYGYPILDLGMLPTMPVIINDEIMDREYHCNREQCALFTRLTLSEYFGKDKDEAWIEKELVPFVIIRLLTMESEFGHQLPPAGEEMLEDYMKRL